MMRSEMKITRRKLAVIAGGSVAAGSALVATLAQVAPSTSVGRDWNREARESHQENAQTLAEFELPMPVEPAFQFKP
jgi:hypothetical protein